MAYQSYFASNPKSSSAQPTLTGNSTGAGGVGGYKSFFGFNVKSAPTAAALASIRGQQQDDKVKKQKQKEAQDAAQKKQDQQKTEKITHLFDFAKPIGQGGINPFANAGDFVKNEIVKPTAEAARTAYDQTRVSAIAKSKGAQDAVGDDWLKSQNTEIDRAFKAGEIDKKKADQFRKDAEIKVGKTKTAIQSAENETHTKLDQNKGALAVLETVANTTGLDGIAKTVFTKAAEAATKRLSRDLTEDEFKNLAIKTKSAVPERPPTASDLRPVEERLSPPKVETVKPAPNKPTVFKIEKTPEGEAVYRGVSKGTTDFAKSEKGAFKEHGFSVTSDKNIAKKYDAGGGVIEGRLNPSAKVKVQPGGENGLPGYMLNEEDITKARDEGYDAMKFINKDDEPEMLIFNEDAVKSIGEKSSATGGDTVSGNSARIEAVALEKKLTDKMGDLPQYKSINMKEQAVEATNLINRDKQLAIDVIEGKANPPGNLKAQSVHQALEDLAVKEGDGELLTKLAKSHVNTELSESAQNLRIAAERDPHSAVEQIRQINERLKTRADKRLRKAKTSTDKEVSKAIDTVKKSTRITSKKDLNDFIKGLEC